MNIIVTGGAGFIGSNFVFHMLNKYPDYRIICLDCLTYAGNLSTLAPVMDNPNFRFVKESITDREAVYKLFEEEHPDMVVNFAAESHVDRSIENPEVFLDTNIKGTAVLMDACRKYDLKIGLYSSLMDWHHPDGWKCMTDEAARERFLQYIEDLNVELLTNYGKIDILWYDMPWPRMSTKNWNSVNRNYKLRQLQPDMLINNRSRMAEDFQTPEESLSPDVDMDWEACMTFNGISWGYLDEKQITPYTYSANQVIRMLRKCAASGGNLLLNIGPKADGTVPEEAVGPLHQIGGWLLENGEAAYGLKARTGNSVGSNQIGQCTVSPDQKTVYAWQYIWTDKGELSFGGYVTKPKKVTILSTGENVEFEHIGHRVVFKNLPKVCPDQNMGITVLKMEFDTPIEYRYGSYYPQVNEGVDVSDGFGN